MSDARFSQSTYIFAEAYTVHAAINQSATAGLTFAGQSKHFCRNSFDGDLMTLMC